MTAFDYGVVAILAASAMLGLWRGLVGELLSLLAWIAALVAAWHFGPMVAALIDAVTNPALRLLAGYAVVFVGVLLVVTLVRLALRGLLDALGLSAADRLLGVVFGLGRGLLIVLALVAAGGLTTAPRQPWWSEARLSPPLETAVLAARPWLPPELAKHIRFR